MGGLGRKINTSLHCEKSGMMDLFYLREIKALSA